MTPANMAALHQAAFANARGWSAEEFQSLLASPHCFAAVNGDCFALGRVVVDEAELLTIATHPDAQRQGLGHTALSAYEELSRERGAVSSFLEVAADNPAAIALYFAAGYDTTGKRKAYYKRSQGPAADALLMTRLLT